MSPDRYGSGATRIEAHLSIKTEGEKLMRRASTCLAVLGFALMALPSIASAVPTAHTFPAMVAPKYSREDPEKARTLTCADQFTANKATNGNGGLKWIEKAGGYYSECVVRLKG